MKIIKARFKYYLNASKIENLIFNITQAKDLHCIGDSHIRMFRYTARQHLWLNTRFHFCEAPGGTAIGLVNPNSKTQALNIFQGYISNLRKDSSLLFCLGEVDCGFVIWYRAEKYKLSVDEQFEYSLKNYLTFLKSVQDQGFSLIIVASVPLPTIPDNHNWGTVAKIRSEVKTSLQERTDLTRRYNQRLHYHCEENNLLFLDYEKNILDFDSLTIASRFRHPNPLDHHLYEEQITPILRQKLSALSFW